MIEIMALSITGTLILADLVILVAMIWKAMFKKK